MTPRTLYLIKQAGTQAMTDQTVNLNASECLREIHNIGSTTIHNVCSGASSAVPWGAGDWAIACLLGGLFVAMLGMLVVMLVALIKSEVFGR